MVRSRTKQMIALIFCGLMMGCLLLQKRAYAIVGNAEKYSEFSQQDLDVFHSSLLQEENSETQKQIDRYQELLAQSGGREEKEELTTLRNQLLSLPKRDRFQFMISHDYTYDPNIDRARKKMDWNGDSIFNLNGTGVVDFSGRKTELKFETIYGRAWNWVFSERDFYQIGERLRYRRKHFRKTNQTVQINANRHNSKTVEIDKSGGKLRYDLGFRNTINHNLTKRLSWNGEVDFQKRLFVQEQFDQDSTWQAQASPALFWNFTPKTRIQASYRFGASRIRTKASDSNSHNISVGYFGRITRKSSTSFNIDYQRQVPRAFESPKVRGITLGIGYILQLTPKTQLTTQIIRNVQNTSSNAAAGTAGEGDSGAITKTDSHFTNTSITLSVNSNLNKKLNANVAFTPSYLTTTTFQNGDQSDETRQWNFPISTTTRYVLTRWLNVSVGYTFDFRRGKSNIGSYRTHVFKVGLNATF